MTEIILSDISENKRVPRIKKAPRHIGRGRPLRQAGRRDELDGNLPPTPTVCLIDKDSLTVQFYDLYNFLKACEHLEKIMSMEFYAECPGNSGNIPVDPADKDTDNDPDTYPINDNISDCWSEDDLAAD